MDYCVMTSMSVKKIHTTAMSMHSAKTPLVPMTVPVAQDSKEMDCCVMTSTNVVKEVFSVTLMLAVLTRLALSAAIAEKATLEVDNIVKVSTESTISFVKHFSVYSFPLEVCQI